jgi:hypothetical protein
VLCGAVRTRKMLLFAAALLALAGLGMIAFGLRPPYAWAAAGMVPLGLAWSALRTHGRFEHTVPL